MMTHQNSDTQSPDPSPLDANNEVENDDSLNEDLEDLAAISGISELERQVFISHMGWGDEDDKTHAEVARLFQLTIPKVRSITKSVGQRFLAQKKRYKPKSFQIEPPAAGELCPRDGEPLQKSSDVLFLAKLLEDCRATGWAEYWRDPNTGHCYRAITKPESSAPKGHQYLKMSTLRKIMKEHDYCQLRRLNLNPEGHQMKLPDGHVLKYPISKTSESQLEDSLDLNAQSWTSTIPPVMPSKHHVLCPFCGPMTTIVVSVTSPLETWRMMCGRAYDYTCCSGCLGVLDSRLTMRN